MGDAGPAIDAWINGAMSLAVNASGDLLIADLGNSLVRLVAANSCSHACPYGLSSMTKGDIYTVAGNGGEGYSGDGQPATSAELWEPRSVALDASGDLLIADADEDRVRLVAARSCSKACPYGLSSMTKGDIYTAAGNGSYGYSGAGGAATNAALAFPSAVTVDAHGDLLIASTNGSLVLLVAANSCAEACPYGLSSMTKGDLYTVAGDIDAYGNIYPGYAGDGGPATSAELFMPSGLAVDAGGDLLIGDTYNNRVRLVAASSCSQACAFGLSSTTAGDIYTVAGGGSADPGDGGPATSAKLNYPSGVAVNAAGDLLIADQFDDRVRLVVP